MRARIYSKHFAIVNTLTLQANTEYINTYFKCNVYAEKKIHVYLELLSSSSFSCYFAVNTLIHILICIYCFKKLLCFRFCCCSFEKC